jgi:hypothetical protein
MRWQPGQGELSTSRLRFGPAGSLNTAGYIRRAADSVALSAETIADDTVDAGWQPPLTPAVINYAISPHLQETRDADDNRTTWFSGVVWLPTLSFAIPIPLSRRRSIILPIQFAGPFLLHADLRARRDEASG